MTPRRTPLFERQSALGGRFVDFAGWDMPIQFSTITQEHQAVRERAGIFDISHMGQVFVTGRDAENFLQGLITNDLNKAAPGRGIYAHLLTERGAVIDDIYVFRLPDERFFVVINASRRQPDVEWMTRHINGRDVSVTLDESAAAIAVQGPAACTLASQLWPELGSTRKNDIRIVMWNGKRLLISRTGYTGEDGCEIFGPAAAVGEFWDTLFAHAGGSLTPCGLGARDTLRTEAGYPLYGHELNEHRTPLEAGLSWVVKFDKGDFMGREALLHQREAGLTEILRGFEVLSGGVARADAPIAGPDGFSGRVASGTFAPTLGKPIGMAFLPASAPEEGWEFEISQGSRTLRAVTRKLPFYTRGAVGSAAPSH